MIARNDYGLVLMNGDIGIALRCILPSRLRAVLARELAYTGITGAKHWFSMIESRPKGATRRRVVRRSGLVVGLSSLR